MRILLLENRQETQNNGKKMKNKYLPLTGKNDANWLLHHFLQPRVPKPGLSAVCRQSTEPVELFLMWLHQQLPRQPACSSNLLLWKPGNHCCKSQINRHYSQEAEFKKEGRDYPPHNKISHTSCQLYNPNEINFQYSVFCSKQKIPLTCSGRTQSFKHKRNCLTPSPYLQLAYKHHSLHKGTRRKGV